jgi:membrane-associated phospholipid phosphatase
MNAESSRLRSTGTISSDMRAIWPGALLVVYLTGTLALLLVAHTAPVTGIALHVATLAAIAAATWASLVPGWLRAWAPLMSLLFLYAEMPMLIRAAGGGHTVPRDSVVLGWEQAVFGFQPAIEWAARYPSIVVSELLHAGYLSYYPIIFVVPALLWLRGRRAEFAEATFAIMATFVACFIAYLFFPVEGPRYSFHRFPGALDGHFRSLAVRLLEARSSPGTAFPSSHVAVATTVVVLSFRYFERLGPAIALATICLALGAVYGGFHFGVDVIAGAVLGLTVTVVSLAVLRRDQSGQAKASAPT